MPDQQPLIIIVGPTAVGKTEVAVRLAEHLDGEIVSADSRLLYRGMDIGTAKTSSEDRKRVRHHLIDEADPDEIWSLALFQEQARLAIAGIHSRNKLPFLVGGTGQYIRALTQAWDLPKVAPDPALRAALESWSQEIGPLGLHARLDHLDSAAAAEIDPRNLRRTVRALEVILTTGRLFSAQRSQSHSTHHKLMIGLNRPRTELYARIDARIDGMISQGLVAEVQNLLSKGYSPDLPTLTAIGYREIIEYLQQKISLDVAVQQIKRKTRLFVRRQANWFKPNDPEIHWFQAGQDIDRLIQHVIEEFIR